MSLPHVTAGCTARPRGNVAETIARALQLRVVRIQRVHPSLGGTGPLGRVVHEDPECCMLFGSKRERHAPTIRRVTADVCQTSYGCTAAPLT